MLKIKTDSIYQSKLLTKFINTFVFKHLKIKVEKILYYSFYYWKKQLATLPVFYFFETLIKIKPLLGFYSYIVKKKHKNKIKIKAYFMTISGRWQKALYWLSRSIKIKEQNMYFNIINELYDVVFHNKSNALLQKLKYYKTILSFKANRKYKW